MAEYILFGKITSTTYL